MVSASFDQAAVVVGQDAGGDLDIQVIVPHRLARHEVRHVVAHPRLRLSRSTRPQHLVPARVVVVGELGLGVDRAAIAFDGERIRDVAGACRPGAGVFHHHVGADALAAVQKAGVKPGAQVRVRGACGLVLEGQYDGVLGGHGTGQAAIGGVGDLRDELALGLRHQCVCNVAVGVEHLGFQFQIPVRRRGDAGRAIGFCASKDVNDACFAGLHVVQLDAEDGETGGTIAVRRDLVGLQGNGRSPHLSHQPLRRMQPVARFERLAKGDWKAGLRLGAGGSYFHAGNSTLCAVEWGFGDRDRRRGYRGLCNR